METLRLECGFTTEEFSLFREVIANLIIKPENRIGFEGPGVGPKGSQRRVNWEQWLDSLIDGGIGNQYWGPGTARKWSFPIERDK